MVHLASIPPERLKLMYPTLTPQQMERIAAVGKRRKVARGEVMIRQGDPAPPFMLVISGETEIVQPTPHGEEIIANHHPGEFTGELNLISGRRSLVDVRMKEAGEVIELDRSELQGLVQNDVELSQILMSAFIYRRRELIAQGAG